MSRYPRRRTRRLIRSVSRLPRRTLRVAQAAAAVTALTGLTGAAVMAWATDVLPSMPSIGQFFGPADPAPAQATSATVVRVVDGDTIVVDEAGAEVTVRILGVDTPETKHPFQPVGCYGPEAAAYLTALLPAGTTVQLTVDSIQPGRDRYGRALRHVHLPNGTATPLLVSSELIRGGYGTHYTDAPTDVDEFLRSTQGIAAEHRTGLWGACPR